MYQQKGDWQADMQTWNAVVERIVTSEEGKIPAIMVHQRLDTRNVTRCHFYVEEEIEWNGEHVDDHIVHGR